MSYCSDFTLLVWPTSTFSSGDGCVQVAPYRDEHVALRDSKNSGGAVMLFAPHEWQSFVLGIHNREFDHLVPGTP